MKVPAALLSPILPLSSSLAAAITFTAVYGLLSPLGYAYFGIWKVGVHGDAGRLISLAFVWFSSSCL